VPAEKGSPVSGLIGMSFFLRFRPVGMLTG